MREDHSARSHGSDHATHNASTPKELGRKARFYNIKLQTSPVSPLANRPTLLRIVVTDSAVSNPIREFDLVHGRRSASSRCLRGPRLLRSRPSGTPDGVFQLAFTFPKAGPYRFWAEAKPKGGERALVAFRLRVEGGRIHQPIALVPDRETTKAVMDGQYRVTLTPRDAVAAEKPVFLTFSLAHPDGSPVTDLRPLMSAGGHCVVISERTPRHSSMSIVPARSLDPGVAARTWPLRQPSPFPACTRSGDSSSVSARSSLPPSCSTSLDEDGQTA